MSDTASAMKIDDLVDLFIKTRDKRAELKAEYEAADAKYQTVQAKIEAVMLARFAEMGVESVRTESGTAYASTRATASMGDWDSFREFCRQQEDPFEFLDKRVNKSAVEQYKAVHQDLPPGVNWSETRVVGFRRK